MTYANTCTYLIGVERAWIFGISTNTSFEYDFYLIRDQIISILRCFFGNFIVVHNSMNVPNDAGFIGNEIKGNFFFPINRFDSTDDSGTLIKIVCIQENDFQAQKKSIPCGDKTLRFNESSRL